MDLLGMNAALMGAEVPLAPDGVRTMMAEKAAAETALADALTKAKALTDALAANGATIAGCATQIAALTALYPAADAND